MEEPVQAGGLQVPVGDQHPLAVGGEDPGGVGQRHRPAGAALVRVEGDDLAVAVGAHRASLRGLSNGAGPGGEGCGRPWSLRPRRRERPRRASGSAAGPRSTKAGISPRTRPIRRRHRARVAARVLQYAQHQPRQVGAAVARRAGSSASVDHQRDHPLAAAPRSGPRSGYAARKLGSDPRVDQHHAGAVVEQVLGVGEVDDVGRQPEPLGGARRVLGGRAAPAGARTAARARPLRGVARTGSRSVGQPVSGRVPGPATTKSGSAEVRPGDLVQAGRRGTGRSRAPSAMSHDPPGQPARAGSRYCAR